MQLEVRVWGMDSTGKPFNQAARTLEISGKGARLEGVTCLQQVGEIVGVQHGNQKARFRVVWVGKKGTGEEGQIGITCLEPDRVIWAEALQDNAGQYGRGPVIVSPSETPAESSPPVMGAARQAERRRYPRYQCTGAIQLTQQDTSPILGKLIDIGLGGFYVEVPSPLPQQMSVEFIIQADELEVRGRGMVRTAHPLVGNGIAFTQMTADDWRRLTQLVARLANPPPREPPVQAVRTLNPEIAQPLQVLLELLEKKGVLTRDEFLAELIKTKA